jgi:hypothetical protein
MNLNPDQVCFFSSSMGGSKKATKPIWAEISMF